MCKTKNFFSALVALAVLCYATMFAGCGDDNSASVNDEQLSSSVESSISSADAKSSSSSKEKTDKSSNSSKEDKTAESSSSVKKDKSSSSVKGDNKSSSSAITDSVKTSRFSDEKYDCSVYNCVATDYLNQDFLAEGKYGEVLDTRDSQVYKTIKIGEQIWMAQNLNLRYTQSTAELDSSSFCYNNLSEYCDKFGRLYIWSAVMDSAGVYSSTTAGCGRKVICNKDEKVRGICPEGFHLPNVKELYELFENTGGVRKREMIDSAALRSHAMWIEHYNNMDYGIVLRDKDSYGFAALPAGSGDSYKYFKGVYSLTYFWSSSEDADPEDRPGAAMLMAMFFYNVEQLDFITNITYNGKDGTGSVRCIKD